MDLFELLATLGIDTNPFVTGLQDALQFALRTLVDFGRDVIQTGMGFDEQMSAVQAVLGPVEGSIENMNRLRKEALLEARESIFTAEETAQAYYYMGMAGWKTEEMLAGLPGIMDLAAASGEDLAMVSDIVTDSITAFGLTASDVTDYVNILAQTATNSNTDVKRMGETFKYVAPIAGTLGYSVEDVALSIGLLASAGIKGSQAGTTLRNIFQRLATNAGATTKDLGALDILTNKLGVDFYDTTGKARPWLDVITEARAAWRGMSEEDRVTIFDEFGDGAKDGQEAVEQFTKDATKIQELLTKRDSTKSDEAFEHYSNQILNLGSQYTDLLEALDIPVDLSQGIYSAGEFAESIDQARIKLGLMSDQEKIYFAKQVGSLRGMAGFIRLLEAEDADLTQLTESYDNARGAAERMAGVRLDNLAGDVKMFNAAFDVLKIAIFDDIKGPLREVTQFGTDALLRITDAINENGLTGGIEQLGVEIETLGEKFTPLMESIGKAIGPLIDTIINQLLPRMVDVGEQLAAGLLKGLGNGMADTGDSFLGMLGTVLGSAGYALDGASSLWKALGLGSPVGDRNDYMHNASASLDTVDDWMLPPELQPDKPVDLFVDPMLAPDAVSNIESDLSGISTGGMEDAIASAGQSGGARAAAEVESAINNGNYSINVAATVSGLLGLPFQHNASAMAQGRIFTRPTVFGVANGAYQIAGDAGPEAVVGTNSLNSMINKSVNNSVSAAMSGMLDQLGGIADRMTGYAPKIYLDGRTLVGQLAPEMNGQLNDIAEWKGYGRA